MKSHNRVPMFKQRLFPIKNFSKRKVLSSYCRPLAVLALALFCGTALSQPESNLPKFSQLSTEEISSWDDYSEPFLIVRSAKKFHLSVAEMTELVRSELKKNSLKVKTAFSKTGEPIENFLLEKYQLPDQISEEKQMEAIQECNKEKCLMKLRTETEVARIVKTKKKKDTYRQVLYERLKSYLQTRELMGYEDRKSNEPYIIKMVDLIPTLRISSGTYQFLRKTLWKAPQDPGKPSDSWIRQEMVNIAPDQMQPILRISEDMEFQENGRALFFELPIYTNHYFDSSLSLYEVFGVPTKPAESAVVFTDVMEIDELKKSSLIRALFKGKMVTAISKYQEEFLENLRPVKGNK